MAAHKPTPPDLDAVDREEPRGTLVLMMMFIVAVSVAWVYIYYLMLQRA